MFVFPLFASRRASAPAARKAGSPPASPSRADGARKSPWTVLIALMTVVACSGAASAQTTISVSGPGTVSEGAGFATFAITISADPASPQHVTYTTSPLGASAGSDYTTTSNSVDFVTGGARTFNVSVPIVNDSIGEKPEQFQLVISGNPNITTNTATASISDDDPPAGIGFSSSAPAPSGQGSPGNIFAPATRVTVTGNRFKGQDDNDFSVEVAGVTLPASAIVGVPTANTIVFDVPTSIAAGQSGPIKVTTSGGTGVSTSNFTVPTVVKPTVGVKTTTKEVLENEVVSVPVTITLPCATQANVSLPPVQPVTVTVSVTPTIGGAAQRVQPGFGAPDVTTTTLTFPAVAGGCGSNVTQQVTLTYSGDDIAQLDGTLNFKASTSSTDPNYNDLSSGAATVIRTDPHRVDVFEPTVQPKTSESDARTGRSTAFTVGLFSAYNSTDGQPPAPDNSNLPNDIRPSAPVFVTVGVTSNPTNPGHDNEALIFTDSQPIPKKQQVLVFSADVVASDPLFYTKLQNVYVQGVDDSALDGDQAYQVQILSIDSRDFEYVGLNRTTTVGPTGIGQRTILTNIDDEAAGFQDLPGVLISPTPNSSSPLTTNESGSTATFAVRLSGKPTANVTINLTSSRPDEGTVSPATLTFTPANYNQNQTVTITGKDDDVVDGTQNYLIVTTLNSTDTNYGGPSGSNGIDPSDVYVQNQDNEVTGVTVTPTRLTLVEGDQGTFNVVLSKAPSTDVFINVSSANPALATINKSRLRFTATKDQAVSGSTSGWNVPQTVTISSAVDNVSQADQTTKITLDPAISADTNYNGVDPSDVTVDILNDLRPSISIANTTVTEGTGGLKNAVFTVTLSHANTQAITVDYATAGGTATSGSDFTATTGTLTIPANQTSAQVMVPVTTDNVDETDETFTVALSNVDTNEATIDTTATKATGTIVDDDGPTVSIGDITTMEGASGVKNFSFPVTLSAASPQDVTVDYATADGTATVADADYLAKSGTLTFTAGTTTQNVVVSVNGDTVNESDESFFVNLSNVSPTATLADSQGIGTIKNDDTVPAISISDPSVTEGDTGKKPITFVVTLSSASASDVSVDYTTANSSAVSPDDYDVTTGTLTIPAGQTSGSFDVSVAGDTVDEIDESFNVNLNNEVNATLAKAQGVGTILDDDGLPALSIGNKTILEGTGGTSTVQVPVTLSPASGRSVMVNYSTSPGTATSPEDFTASSGQITFFPGETVKNVPVIINGDASQEGDEDFTVNLSGGTNATIAAPSATVLITDDDATPTLSIGDATIKEGNAGTTDVTFTVALSSASGKNITVDYATADGSAKEATDYTKKTGTLTFPKGVTTQLVTVAVKGDLIDETDETFSVTLSNPVNAIIGSATATGTIQDDDASPSITVNSAQVVEGNTAAANGAPNNLATFTLTLSEASEKQVSVSVQTKADTLGANPASDTDYKKLFPTVVTFNPGETTKTVTVEAVPDTLSETDETFLFELSNPVNATVATPTGTGTIVNDDTVPVLSIGPATVVEGDEGTKTDAVFTVTMSAATGRTVTVNYATAAGTATQGTDYSAASGPLVFTPGGPLTQTVTVKVNGDSISEPNETYKVSLSGAVGATIDPTKIDGIGTITDDDVAGPTIAATGVAPLAGHESYGGVAGTTVTITGTNFIPGATTVTFGVGNTIANSEVVVAARDVNVAADGKSLQVVVPTDAYSGQLKVETTQGSNVQPVPSPKVFIVQPVITDFFDTDDGDQRGVALIDSFHVTGKHFLDPLNGSLSKTLIKVGGVATTPTNGSTINIIDDQNIEFLLPRGAKTGSLVVATEKGLDGPPSFDSLTVDNVTPGGVEFGPLPFVPTYVLLEDDHIPTDPTKGLVVKRTLSLTAARQQDGEDPGKAVAPVKPIVVTLSVKHSTSPNYMPPTITVVNSADPSQNVSNVGTAQITFPAGQAGLDMSVDVYLTYAGDDIAHGDQTITTSAIISKNNADPNYAVGTKAPDVVDDRIDLHGISVDTSTVLRTSELGDSDPNGKGVTQFDVSLANVGPDLTGDPVNSDTTPNVDPRPKFDVLVNLKAVNDPIAGNHAPGSSPEGLISYYVNDVDNDGPGPDVANGLVAIQPIPQATQLFLYAVDPTSNEYYRNEHISRVTGVNDTEFDGDQRYTIVVDTAKSTDSEYDGLLFANPVTLVNTDDETNNQQTGQPGFDFSRLSGLVTNESGSTDIFTVKLKTKPTGPVDLTLDSKDITEGKLVDPVTNTPVQTLTLRFTADGAASGATSTRWDISQTVTIKGQDDKIQDGDQPYVIGTTTSSTDTTYNQIDPPDVNALNQDNELPGATVSPAILLVNEGSTKTFSVVLNLQPTDDVVINLRSNDTTAGTIDKSVLTFTPQNWDTPQVVTVTAVDNAVINKDVPFQIVLDKAISSDTNYNGRDIQDVAVTSLNDDIPGVTVTPVNGLVTTEAGGTATFTLRLNTQPNPNTTVTIPLASSDLTEGTVSPSSVAFDQTNYDQPQTVTVTGVDDIVTDGNVAYNVTTKPAIVKDQNGVTVTNDEYNNFNAADVAVTNQDDDIPSVIVTPVSGLITSEDGDTATFTVKLGAKPAANVTIALSSSNVGEGTVSPPNLTFTAGNYAVAQKVTVTGQDDAGVIDGNQAYTIVTGKTVSTDPNYSGLDVPDVKVINKDNDAFGVKVTPVNGLKTSESGAKAVFTVALTAKPSAPVSIALASSNLGEGDVSPASVTFTGADYNKPQTVTITGVNDDVDDGDKAYTIVTGDTVSTDPNFDGKTVPDVSVTNVDNDTAAVIVSPLMRLRTNEGGTKASFTVALGSAPTNGPVTISLFSSDTSEGTISPASLTFQATDYSVPQKVTITPQDDVILDGTVDYQIKGIVSTSSREYQGMKVPVIDVSNADNDRPGIIVTPSALNLVEGGPQQSFTIALTSQPQMGVVTIALSSSDESIGTVSPSILTFTTANFNVPHTVNVRSVDNQVAQGTRSFTVITGNTQSVDPLFNDKPVEDVPVRVTDNDVAGFTVIPQTDLVTSETGDSTIFRVKLNTIPSADVTIPVGVTPATEVKASPSSLVFTPSNWNTYQIVTVTGVDDDVLDGDKMFAVVNGPAQSTDSSYDGLAVPNVKGTNKDNDVAGIIVNAAANLKTTENGGTATFTVRLQSKPLGYVTIPLTSSNTREGTVSPSSLMFSPDNYSTPRTVTVQGVNDGVTDGNVAYSVAVGPATGDAGYKGTSGATVHLTNMAYQVGFVVSRSSGTTGEDGTQFTFNVHLAGQPSSNVSVGVRSSKTTEGTVSPALLTFTPSNYASDQTVTVTGVNDDLADGNAGYQILFSVVTSDPGYKNLTLSPISAVNMDDDVAGATVTPTSGLTTTEAKGTDSFTVRLTSKPTANVTIPLTSSDTTEGTVSPSSLTFTPANYAAPQTVLVTGVDDGNVDGPVDYEIRTGAAQSTDAKYKNYDAPDVTVTNTDDDGSNGDGTGTQMTDFATIGKTYALSVPFADGTDAASTTTAIKAFTVPPVATNGTRNYTLRRYNASTQQYEDLGSTSVIKRGEGYLIIPVAGGTGIRRPADDTTRKPTAVTSFNVVLHLNPSMDTNDANNGLNLIGFPFDPAKFTQAQWLSATVRTADGTVYPSVTAAADAGVLDRHLFTLDESEQNAGQFVDVTSIGLVPYEGYYARTFQDGVTVTLNVP